MDCDPESSSTVELFLLKRNAAVVLSRSCGRALELLEVAYYNIVIVDANSLVRFSLCCDTSYLSSSHAHCCRVPPTWRDFTPSPVPILYCS